MYIKKHLMIIVASLIYVSCTTAQQKVNKMNYTDTATVSPEFIKKVLSSQLLSGISSSYPAQYGDSDLAAIVPIIKQKLAGAGYVFPSKEKFNAKIKSIFGRIVDTASPTKYLYINYLELDRCKHNLVYFSAFSENQGALYAVKNECFITPLYPIPAITDYQKEYPKESRLEDEKITIHDYIEGIDVELRKWKDLANLKKDREKYIQTTIARNRYLFNDDKSQLNWLWINDNQFMQSLVKEFGYSSDKKLLKLVLDENLYSSNDKYNNKESNPQELGKALWNQKCDEAAIINQTALDVMRESITPNNTQYLNILCDYIMYLNKESDIQMAFQAKANILGHLLYFCQSIALLSEYRDKAPKSSETGYSGKYKYLFMGSFYDIGNKYDDEFKKRNYYNLPHFKEWWEAAKKIGNGVRDDGSQIPDY